MKDRVIDELFELMEDNIIYSVSYLFKHVNEKCSIDEFNEILDDLADCGILRKASFRQTYSSHWVYETNT